MTADFNEIASKAKAAHEERVAQDERKRAADHEARSNAVDAGIAALEANVIPLLDQARTAFAAQGVDSKVTKDFDVKSYSSRNPSVKFWCLGPKRHDGWQMPGPAVLFSSDGLLIEVRAATTSYDSNPTEVLGRVAPSESDALVADAVQTAINRYYNELREHGPFLNR